MSHQASIDKALSAIASLRVNPAWKLHAVGRPGDATALVGHLWGFRFDDSHRRGVRHDCSVGSGRERPPSAAFRIDLGLKWSDDLIFTFNAWSGASEDNRLTLHEISRHSHPPSNNSRPSVVVGRVEE